MKKLTLIIMTAALFIAASCEKQQEPIEGLKYEPKAATTAYASITLGEGWQGFSTNIEMMNMNAADFFGQYPEIELAKTIDGRVYWNYNGTTINTIGDINCLDGYQLHLTGGCTIEMEGVYTSATMPQSLPVGRSMWGCPYQYPVYPNIAYPMPQPAAQTDIIKRVTSGHAFWEYYGINQIGNIAPYECYMVHIDDGENWTPAMFEEYNGFGRIKRKHTKSGDTCGIMLQPSYFDVNGYECDESEAVVCIMPDGEVIWY